MYIKLKYNVLLSLNLRQRIANLFFLVFCFIIISCASKKTTVSKDNSGKAISEANEVKFKASYYEACREKIKGNVEQAEVLFKECIKINPNSAPAKYELAGLYRFAGLYDNALSFAREAAASDEKNEWYQMLYVECLHHKRMYNEAIEVYEKLTRQFPNRPEFYESLANECVFAGKIDKALEAYKKLETKVGKTESVSIEKIKIYKQLKRYSEAEKELKELIKDYPSEEKYYTYLAELYQDIGKPEKAYETYQEALKISPGNPYIHLALADYYRIQRNQPKLHDELKIAFESPELEIDSKIKILVSIYALTEEMVDQKPQAYELCEILIKVHTEEPKAFSVYGDFLYRDKKYKEAKGAFLKVLEFDKSKYIIWNQLLICESELKESDSLLVHADAAIELFPNQALPYYLKGLAHYKKKQNQEAIQSLIDGQEFVYNNQPFLLQFLVTLAEVYHSDKKYELSDKTFEEALLIDPDNSTLLNNYAYYLAQRKANLEKAMKMSERSLERQATNVSFMDTKGFILFQQEKYNEAKIQFQKALTSGGDKNTAVLEHLGDTFFKLNEKSNSVKYWKMSQELGNSSETLEKKIKNQNWYE